MIYGLADLPKPGIMIGEYEYFTVQQLANALQVPDYHFLKLVRAGEFHGRKVGKVYLISATEFCRWVESGNFQYKHRVRAKRETYGSKGREETAADDGAA